LRHILLHRPPIVDHPARPSGRSAGARAPAPGLTNLPTALTKPRQDSAGFSSSRRQTCQI
jgi:hypothetical protein